MMALSAESCFLVFVMLLIASMVMQWIRAKKRQRLVRTADPLVLPAEDRDQWLSIEGGMDFLFKDFRKLQILKRNLDRATEDTRILWKNYRGFSRAEMAVTFAMVLFAAMAFLVCGS